MRSWLPIAALLSAAGLAGAAWVLRPADVPIAVVTRGDAAEVVYATGVVEPVRWAEITTTVRARIVESCGCEGAPVARGDPLFRLDDAAERAHLRELQARLELAEKSLARIEPLLARGVVPPDSFDEAASQVAELTAAVAVAESRMEDLTIRSPLDGLVLRLDAEPGEVAEPGAPLGWVGQPAPLRVEAEVNEEDMPRLRIGQEALLRADAFPDRVFEARLDAVTPMGDPDLKTYRVRLALPPDAPLMIGMSVDVNIVERVAPGVLLAPAAAVIDGAVFALEDGRLRRVPVRIGIAGADYVELADGAAEGMRVVSPASEDLRDGMRARAAPGAAP